MGVGGDYAQFHTMYQDAHTVQSVLAGDAGPFTLITVRSANHQIFVQRVFVSVTTFSAKTWTLQDSNGTPVQVGLISIPAAAGTTQGLTPYIIDFGPHGFQLTKGTNLTLTLSGAGAAAIVTVDAYVKLIGPVAAASTN